MKGPIEWLQAKAAGRKLIGVQQTPLGFEGRLQREHYSEDVFGSRVSVDNSTLDDISVYTQEEH